MPSTYCAWHYYTLPCRIFRRRILNSCIHMSTEIFQMAAVCHVRFFLHSKFYLRLRFRETIWVTVSQRSVKPLLRFGDFFDFQKGGRPPSWSFKISKFCTVACRGPVCVITPNFMEIGQTVTEVCQFNWFEHGGSLPS